MRDRAQRTGLRGPISGLAARIAALLVAALGALAPGIAAAEELRALDRPDDSGGVIFVTALGVIALFTLAGLGYLYRQERGIVWWYQRPEPAADHGEHADHAAPPARPASHGGHSSPSGH
jgi:hypothetical protein